MNKQKLIALLEATADLDRQKEDLNTQQKDIATEAEFLGVPKKVFAAVYKVYKDPEGHKTMQEKLDEILELIRS